MARRPWRTARIELTLSLESKGRPIWPPFFLAPFPCYGVGISAKGTTMKLHGVKECLDVHNSDISGSAYDDVNMSGSVIGNVNLAGCSFKQVNMSGAAIEDANLSGWKVHDVNFSGLKIMQANLQGASIKDSRLDGMTINGILVTDLLAAYQAAQPASA
jgi:uncharacterized protein YjbI with pentapeptide repeats